MTTANTGANPANLEAILDTAQLPALPQSAIRILEVTKDPENGPAELATPIEADPGLASQVLKFVNSSYFGFSREISNVKLAITLVGVRTIKNFTLWSAVFSLMPNPKCGPFDLKSLWQDSLRRAVFARGAGLALGMKEAEDVFAAALLQDMAVPLLAKSLSEKYVEMLESRDDGRARLSALENAALGWNHAEAAALLATRWNLPAELVDPIRNHIDTTAVVENVAGHEAEVAVALSALLPATIDSRWHEIDAFEACFRKAFPGEAGDETALREVLAKTDNDFAEFAPVLKVETPAKSLVNFFSEIRDEEASA